MAPGNRAMDMLLETWDEDRLSHILELGTDPIEAIREVFGLEGALRRIERAKHLHPYHKEKCLLVLAQYEAERALDHLEKTLRPSALEHADEPEMAMVGGSYRTAPTLVVASKETPKSVWARLWAWLKSR